MGYSPRGRKEPDTTEQLHTSHRQGIVLGYWGETNVFETQWKGSGRGEDPEEGGRSRWKGVALGEGPCLVFDG